MLYPRALLIVLMVCVTLSPPGGRAESASVEPSAADEASLRALYARMQEGWNRGSGADFAAVFDRDADLVGPGGFHLRGRDRIASFHQTLFDGMLRGTQLVGVVRSIRFLTRDVAVVHAVGGPTRHRRSLHTFVAVRRSGSWRLDTFQTTPI